MILKMWSERKCIWTGLQPNIVILPSGITGYFYFPLQTFLHFVNSLEWACINFITKEKEWRIAQMMAKPSSPVSFFFFFIFPRGYPLPKSPCGTMRGKSQISQNLPLQGFQPSPSQHCHQRTRSQPVSSGHHGASLPGASPSCSLLSRAVTEGAEVEGHPGSSPALSNL